MKKIKKKTVLQSGPDDPGINELDQGLDSAGDFSRSLEGIFLMPAGKLHHKQYHYDTGYEDGTDVLGYRKIPGLVFLAVDNLDQFSLVVPFGGNLENGVAVLIYLSVGYP